MFVRFISVTAVQRLIFLASAPNTNMATGPYIVGRRFFEAASSWLATAYSLGADREPCPRAPILVIQLLVGETPGFGRRGAFLRPFSQARP